MSKNLHINDAFAGFGNAPNKIKENMNATGRMRQQVIAAPSQVQLQPPPPVKQQTLAQDMGKYPSHASDSSYPIKVRCPKCSNVSVTRMSSQLGTAAWVWCVLLAPFACTGLSCLYFDSCRDKVHFCTRCNNIVGKKFAKVC